jgi:hypothetical protein
MSIDALSLRCTQTCDEIRNVAVLDFPVTQQVGRLAKEISSLSTSGSDAPLDDIASLLQALCDACADATVKAVLWNNLACVQKKQGNSEGAVVSLNAAVKAEGGMLRALPTTLINLSAALASQGRYEEAAAAAHRAIVHSARPSSPASKEKGTPASRSLAAAYYNLAVALQGSGHTEHALETYHEVLLRVDDRDAYAIAAIKARNNLMLVEQDSTSKVWAAHVAPSIVQQAAGGAPPKRSGKLPPLSSSMIAAASPSRAIEATSQPRSTSAMEVLTSKEPSEHLQRRSGTSMSVTATNNKRRHPVRQPLRGDISQVYAQPVQKYHSLPPLIQPIPYEDRVHPAAHADANLSTSLIPPVMSLAASNADVDVPDWNPDPVLHPHSLSYRVMNPNEKKHWALIHEVESRFIPRSLVPLVEDMRYKESTRRTMIIKEWKRRFDIICRARNLAATSGQEDTARLSIEVEEARVRRVMRQWIAGKLLFAEAMIRLEKEEAHSRDAVAKQAHQSGFALQFAAVRLHPQGLEEMQRAAIAEEERAALSDITVHHFAATTLMSSRATMRQNVGSTAYALALWCIEGVVPEASLPQIEVASRKKSLAVLERFAVYGKQQRPPSD